jgi:cholesterol oxidase
MYTVERTPLANDWNDRRPDGYDIIVIGSGYGGAITAARLANAQWPEGKPSICILERGQEWLPGRFPDNLSAGSGALRSPLNPLGLYDFRIGADIGAWMASGLGGTSLINANVAIVPDAEVFDNPQWPQAIRDARDSGLLKTLFGRVRSTLHAGPHPQGRDLSKVKALQLGAQGIAGADFDLCDIAVNFEFEGNNAAGVAQRRCINCGDCITGCNVGAKNTLDTNYLALAKAGGAHIFTQVEVDSIAQTAAGGYTVQYKRHGNGDTQGVLQARRTVVVSAGALGSTGIMLRSRANGLGLPATVGTRFSGNGDFIAFAYNGDHRTDELGWGAYPDSDRARRIQPAPPPAPTLFPGPSIVARIKYHTDKALAERVTFEDLSLPLIYVDAARATFATFIGKDTDPGDFFDDIKEFGRRARDFGALDPRLEGGALNYTLMYLIMGHDGAGGRVGLDDSGEPKIVWPGVGGQPLFQNEVALALAHATGLGATFIENPIWAFSPFHTLLTPHPLGGCPMGESPATAVVNHLGQVFNADGTVHDGLYIADGSILPTAIGVNPFLTISALTERIAEGVITKLGGIPQAEAQAAAGG